MNQFKESEHPSSIACFSLQSLKKGFMQRLRGLMSFFSTIKRY